MNGIENRSSNLELNLSLLALSECSYYIINSDFIILEDCEDRTVRQLFNHENLSGKSLFEITPFNSCSDFLLDRLNQAINDNTTVEDEISYCSKNQSDLTFKLKLAPLTQEKLIVVLCDKTAERQKSEELKRNRQQLDLQTANSKLGMIEWDAGFNVTRWNEAATAIFGYTESEVIGKNPFNLIIPDSAKDYVKQVWNDLLKNRGGLRSVNENNTKNGDIIICSWHSQLLVNDENTITGVISVVKDITRNIQTEVALVESDIRFHELANLLPQPIFELDTNGNLTYGNRAAYDLTGHTPKDFARAKNKSALLFYIPQDRLQVARNIRKVLRGEKYDRQEYTLLRKDGSTFPALIYASAILKKGEPIGIRGTAIDISELKAAQEKIDYLAFFDQLTNLPNRNLLLDRLRHTMATSASSKNYCALLFIDLDNFKMLLDTLGGHESDQLLKAAAERISKCVKPTDTVARLGRDEFLVILEDFNPELKSAAIMAERIAEKIIAAIHEPYCFSGRESYFSASVGVAMFSGMENSEETLLKRSEAAMKMAKSMGRNRLHFFNPEMQKAMEERISMEYALRHALQNDELEIYLQPIVNKEEKIIGAESLLRWHHPERGLIYPGEFIPLAEVTGLIEPIGRWVTDRACQQLKTWQSDPATESLFLSINISALQFHQVKFVSFIKETINKHEIKPDKLKLELTESVLLEDSEEAIARLTSLADYGIRFSIDDFGTGYSSLNYLKNLPLENLKIDRSFIKNILTDESDQIMVDVIIKMSHSFNLSVIAEGIETKEQFDLVSQHNCFAYQGYFFGIPQPIVEFEKML